MPWEDWWKFEANNPKVHTYEPYFVAMEPMKTHYWCACGHSKTQPWCDGSHKKIPEVAARGFKPVAFHNDYKGVKALCGCKFSERRPYCNATHWYVRAHHMPAQAAASAFMTTFLATACLGYFWHP